MGTPDPVRYDLATCSLAPRSPESRARRRKPKPFVFRWISNREAANDAVRGYLLTGDDAFFSLRPYDDFECSRKVVTKKFGRLGYKQNAHLSMDRNFAFLETGGTNGERETLSGLLKCSRRSVRKGEQEKGGSIGGEGDGACEGGRKEATPFSDQRAGREARRLGWGFPRSRALGCSGGSRVS